MKNIKKSDITNEIKQNFINYAMAANCDRAIPDARTGLKPVARRILYIMSDMGSSSSKPHRKSARTVGDVMGRVHPHGDTSIYGAMVRLSQPWVMRYPLVNWHGNNGSVGGDGPAAARYTESKLEKISEQGMLNGLKKNNVDTVLNYSEDEYEPVTLPALFPNLLCNPNSGIGVSLACEWLPHNLTEVGNIILNYLNTNKFDFSNLAPDFPKGGTIINKNDLISIYKTGKGKAVVRGNYTVEKNKIIFTEIPYGVPTETLLEQINDLCEKEKIKGISEVRDESDKKGLRLVFELKKGASIKATVESLFRYSNLQKSFSANQRALVGKEIPLLNWEDCIKIYVQANLEIIQRETNFDLDKAMKQLEITNGLLKALLHIDELIALIKKSKNASAARTEMEKKYDFTENQSLAIVNMKLGKLASLEQVELNEKKAELDKAVDALQTLLKSEDKQKAELYNRLKSFIATFGDARRTQVTQQEVKTEEAEIAAIAPEDVVIILTKNGMVKKVPTKSYTVQKRAGKGIKNLNNSTIDTLKTNTIDTLIFFSSLGRVYRLISNTIPVSDNKGKGVPIGSLITLAPNEKIEAMSSLKRVNKPTYLIFITKQGRVKKSLLSEYIKGKTNNKGTVGLKLKDGDAIVKMFFMEEEELILVTKKGYSIRFKTDNIRAIGKAAIGIKGIKLKDGDEVVSAAPVHKLTDTFAIFQKDGKGKKCELKEFPIQLQGGLGVIASKNEIVDCAMLSDNDNLIITGNNTTIRITAKDISLNSRIASGVALIKDNQIISVAKI